MRFNVFNSFHPPGLTSPTVAAHVVRQLDHLAECRLLRATKGFVCRSALIELLRRDVLHRLAFGEDRSSICPMQIAPEHSDWRSQPRALHTKVPRQPALCGGTQVQSASLPAHVSSKLQARHAAATKPRRDDPSEESTHKGNGVGVHWGIARLESMSRA